MAHTEAEGRFEMAAANPEGSGRNPREYEAGASNVTARTESDYPETLHLMEAVVECVLLLSLVKQLQCNP